MSQLPLDAAGRRRSPATLPGFHAGRPPRNKGRRYPADPPTIEEIVAVMRHAGNGLHGQRLRGLIVVLWRAGLRIHEALALNEGDLDRRRGSLLVRRGKGGRRREVGMDEWAWEQLQPWLDARTELPVGPLFCIVTGPTRGRAWSNTAVRAQLRHVAAQAGVRCPASLRSAPATPLTATSSRRPIRQRTPWRVIAGYGPTVRPLLCLSVMIVMLALPSAAAAKDCSAYKPFVRNGVSWVVYTFVEPGRAGIPCSKARRITANAMRGRKVIGWQCSRARQRCVRGGTFVDDYGFRQWRFLVGWHVAD